MRTQSRKQRLEAYREAFAEAVASERKTGGADGRGYIQCMNAATLALVARGEIDLNALAIDDLASRGLDSNGEWVGFERARELAEEAKQNLVGGGRDVSAWADRISGKMRPTD